MNDVLRLEAIAKSYNPGTPAAVSVLSDLDLAVGRSEVVALVGESGSGKSTVARMIAGLTKPTAGRVLFDGIEDDRYIEDCSVQIQGIEIRSVQVHRV